MEDAAPGRTKPTHRSGWWPLILGTVAGLAVLVTLGDPGITSDEPIDVKVGRSYFEELGKTLDRAADQGIDALNKRTVSRFFADNAQHPPLGRWLLGASSLAFEPLEGILGGSDPMSVHSARIAPMLAFAFLVSTVTAEGTRRFGRPAGIAAGFALILMPRVFAHAHFATLDTFLSFFWTLALLGAVRAIDSKHPGRSMAAAGILWGLVLLTKIHGWLMPPLIFGYAIFRLGILKAIAVMVVWLVIGLLIFGAGWPWLWFETVERLTRFLSTSVARQPIDVLYFGKVTPDQALPWHYPWFYFLVTVPVGLLVLGLLGAIQGHRKGQRDPFTSLLLGSILLFLLLFSTRAPVYDGERLFLLVFPAFALLIGLGFGTLWQRSRPRSLARSLLVLLMLASGLGVIQYHPFQLSYHSLLVGGLRGAEKLGLELTYWGDTIDSTLLHETAKIVPPGDSIVIAPTFHHLYPTSRLTEELFNRGSQLLPEEALEDTRWLLVFRRESFWSPQLRSEVDVGKVVAVRKRQGVVLAALVDRNSFSPVGREDSFRRN